MSIRGDRQGMTSQQTDDLLAAAARLIAPARQDADALDAEIWRRLADRGWRAANHALAAVLRSRDGDVPRTVRVRMNRLAALAQSDPRLCAFRTDVQMVIANLRVLAVERDECSPTTIQRHLREVEDELLPLARRLCARRRGRRGDGSP